jgi:hypothetical protein
MRAFLVAQCLHKYLFIALYIFGEIENNKLARKKTCPLEYSYFLCLESRKTCDSQKRENN